MGKFNRYLYDEIGREYERKNLYLAELAEIDELLHNRDKDKTHLRKKRRELITGRDKHPYIVQLKELSRREREFKNRLKSEVNSFSRTLSGELDRNERKLKLRLFSSERTADFYRDHKDISYDAEFDYRKAELERTQLPGILDNIKKIKDELIELENLKRAADPSQEALKKSEYESFKVTQKKTVKEEIARIKMLRKEGTISRKAEANLIREAKQKSKNSVKLKELEIPTKGIADQLKSKNIELRNSTKQSLKILKSDIADLRKVTPVEVEKTKPIISYATVLLPGLGQALNGQLGKMAVMIFGSLFIYLIAIPYALGFGNYQGEGVAGLISLAEGGARIDKSLIFMIEGVVSIFLLLLAALVVYISFSDVYRVETGKIKGVRPKTWFENKKSLLEEGFPYVTSLPAMIIILFIVLVPVITTFLLSFTNMDPQHQSKFSWVGIQNYRLIALGEGLAGSVFWLILVWTLIWTFAATTLAILIGFFMALLVNNERVKGKRFFRTIYILPWAVPAFITIMYFSIMTAPGGSITEILAGIFNTRIEIKNNTFLTRTALILIQGWLGSAYVFLLTTGVLQSIPSDLYEAAEIDGATAWDRMIRITVPLVLFQISPLLVTQYTFNFNNFSVIFLFNEGGPFNPQLYGNLAGSSDLLISYIYKLAMMNQYQAIGAAITIFISLGLMVFAYLGFRNSKGFKEGRL
ncbi:ABC transporter permease subunit [Gudongella oleilytica]|uniref:carbohydrate ABC transporter permease n=1 Tax=Gudongella oleilytica TaxID=1582259 RepID=UPI002A36B7CF|nr:ABC transporter permease subunit [Gudongella oleilytica]MDY0256118.1 ABC transporter permease subunit [Gudongella oleilytica]